MISVGNISVGGTGKTPFVIHLLERIGKLTGGKVRTAVVSRGYRGSASGSLIVSNGRKVLAFPDTAGDEPVLIAESSSGAVVVVDKDRVRGARLAIEGLKAKVVVLDDGFQHRRLRRDLDIVLLDAQNPLGNRLVLPAGPLREPVKSLRRADLILLSKVTGELDELTTRAEKLSRVLDRPVAVSRMVPKFWRRVGKGELLTADRIAGKKVVAFAGIAIPDSFFRTVADLQAEIQLRIPLPDHCHYSKAYMDFITRKFVQAKAEWLVTTSKDAIKLPLIFRYLPVYYLDVKMEVVVGGELLDERIEQVLDFRHRKSKAGKIDEGALKTGELL